MQSPLITDWISSISAAVTALAALVYTALTLGLLWYGYKQLKFHSGQLEFNNKWNRLNASFTYFDDDAFYRLTNEFFNEFEKLDIDIFSQTEPLSDEQLKKVLNKDANYNNRDKAIMRVLGFLESYAVAYYADVFNKELSKELYGPTVIYYVCLMNPYIEQESLKPYFENLIKLYDEWKAADVLPADNGDNTDCRDLME